MNTHPNEMNLKVLQVCDFIVDDELKELIGITYDNKMHLLFGCPSLKNSTIKRAWLGEILGWVTFREFFLKIM